MIRRIAALGLILVLAAGIPIQASSASHRESDGGRPLPQNPCRRRRTRKPSWKKALKEAQSTIEDLRDSKGDIESKVTD